MGINMEPTLTARASKTMSLRKLILTSHYRLSVSGTVMKSATSFVKNIDRRADINTSSKAGYLSLGTLPMIPSATLSDSRFP